MHAKVCHFVGKTNRIRRQSANPVHGLMGLYRRVRERIGGVDSMGSLAL